MDTMPTNASIKFVGIAKPLVMSLTNAWSVQRIQPLLPMLLLLHLLPLMLMMCLRNQVPLRHSLEELQLKQSINELVCLLKGSCLYHFKIQFLANYKNYNLYQQRIAIQILWFMAHVICYWAWIWCVTNESLTPHPQIDAGESTSINLLIRIDVKDVEVLWWRYLQFVD